MLILYSLSFSIYDKTAAGKILATVFYIFYTSTITWSSSDFGRPISRSADASMAYSVLMVEVIVLLVEETEEMDSLMRLPTDQSTKRPSKK